MLTEMLEIESGALGLSLFSLMVNPRLVDQNITGS